MTTTTHDEPASPHTAFGSWANRSAPRPTDAELAQWRARIQTAPITPVKETKVPLEWSPQQVTALDRVKRWYLSGTAQVFYLAGYAGTGKTTLAENIKEPSVSPW
jgi:hypothetical protein